MTTKTLPRGLRNNNPGNIRITKDKWKGLRNRQTDTAFFQFESMAWGYRALIRTLQNYRRKHGCQTIADFINRWAPEHENNTTGYIQRVCREMNVHPNYIPDVDNKDTMCAFAAAISQVENATPADMNQVHMGWELLG